MKLICDQCGARYSIADEKVRGKVFKIRCKKCENIIVVRGDAEPGLLGGAGPVSLTDQAVVAPASEPEPASDGMSGDAPTVASGTGLAGEPAAAAPAASAEPPSWYVLVGQQQQGPLTDAEVDALIDNGQATGDTYVWKEGFTDWVPLSSRSEFSARFAAAAPAPYPAGGALGGPELGALGSGRDIRSPVPASGGVAAGLALDAGGAAAVSTPGAGGLVSSASDGDAGGFFASAGAPESGGGMFSGFDASPAVGLQGPPPDASKMVGERNENSVLFSLASLQNLSGGAAEPAAAAPAATPSPLATPAAPAAGMAAEESSGLIQIRSMSEADAMMATAAPAAPAPAPPVASPMMGQMIVRRRKPVGMIVGISVLVVALLGMAGALAYVLTRPDSPEGGPVVATGPKAAAGAAKSAGSGETKDGKGSKKADDEGEDRDDGKGGDSAAKLASAASAGTTAEGAESEEKSGKGGSEDGASKPVARRPARRPASTPSPKPKRVAAASPAPAPAPAARPAPRPRAAAKPKARRPSTAKSEVDSLLEAIDGGGRPARTAPTPAARPRTVAARTPAASTPRTATPAPKKEVLTRGQISSVVRGNKGRVQTCYLRQAEPKLSGTLMVSFRILQSGRVSSARIKTPKFAGTPVGACVLSAVGSLEFPPHGGDPVKITYPFILR